MKLRGLVLAALVLAILAGVLYWSGHRKPATASAGVSGSAAPQILKLDPGAITQLTLKHKGAEPVTLVKGKTGTWQITAPTPLPADQKSIPSLLSTLSSMDSERVVDDRPTDLKRYGLDPPSVEVDVTEKDHKTQRLLMGDDAPIGGMLYAMVAGNPAVDTISVFNKTYLDKTLNDLRDKRLLPVDAEDVQKVEFLRKAQDIELSRVKDGWQIDRPKPLPGDNTAINDFVDKLTGASMDLSDSNTGAGGTGNQNPAAAFAQGTPVATAKITAKSATEVLQVRKDKDSYYAKSSAVDGIYRVGSDFGQALDKDLNDFRSKKLFAFGSNDPSKLEMHSGSKTYSFTLNGKDWWSNGKKMDRASVESLVADLRELTATKFLNAGFAKPVIELKVTSDGGKQVETASIAKSGSGYVARRQQGPSLYQFDASAIDDLEQAANAIKPAGAPSK